MKPSEAAKLLTMAAALDGRMRVQSMDEIQVQAQGWAATLDERITFEQARTLLVDHYANSREVIMPATLNQAFWARRRQLAATHTDPLPAADPNDVTAWLEELRENRRRNHFDPEKYGHKVELEAAPSDPKVEAAISELVAEMRRKLEEINNDKK